MHIAHYLSCNPHAKFARSRRWKYIHGINYALLAHAPQLHTSAHLPRPPTLFAYYANNLRNSLTSLRPARTREMPLLIPIIYRFPYARLYFYAAKFSI